MTVRAGGQERNADFAAPAATTTLSGAAAVKPKNLKNLRLREPSTLTPKGETTHYDLCVALLLQIMFAVHAAGVSNAATTTLGPKARQT